MEIVLGSKVRDRITGLEGIVLCRTVWLNGCIRVGVQAQELKDGRPVDLYTCDEPDLTVIDGGVADTTKDTHGPRPDPVRR